MADKPTSFYRWKGEQWKKEEPRRERAKEIRELDKALKHMELRANPQAVEREIERAEEYIRIAKRLTPAGRRQIARSIRGILDALEGTPDRRVKTISRRVIEFSNIQQTMEKR